MNDASADFYRSPLEGRYASEAMRRLWSDRTRFTAWRRLWIALAESQQALGLDISDAQLDALRSTRDTLDLDAAKSYESKLRHDVMAHVHAWGDIAPEARGIIHLGATSQFVNCNAELLILREALDLVAAKLASCICGLADFASEHRALPTLGFTHFQPAQPTTVGKRAASWAYDIVLALEDIEFRRDTLRFRGVKGTTGTQASFMKLFNNDGDKVEQLDAMVTEKLQWPVDRRFAVTGQTYPRIVDAQLLGSLAAAAAGLHKFGSDMRLLAHRKELEEPFERDQIGSSAMPYKRNPMRSERLCALSRHVMSQAASAQQTAATQWLERTLDDSAIRRLSLSESFLALDACLDLVRNIVHGLVVYPATIRANLMAELPFMASENLMMEAAARGADRQEAHEVIRKHAQDAAMRVKNEGASNDLLERLRGESMFDGIDLNAVLDPAAYVGRASEQVDAFVRDVVQPIRERYDASRVDDATITV